MRTRGGTGIEDEVMTGDGASHCYDTIGDQTLCVDVLILPEVNHGLRAHYIGTSGGAHCPFIEGIAPDQGTRGGLGPLWPRPLEISSNRFVLPQISHSSFAIQSIFPWPYL
jgi:hypothetical protein